MVHPTAIIHPQARIAAHCEIGPYCVVGEHVELGGRCRLHSHVVIDGHTRLGHENEIFPFASLGLKTQDLKWKGGRTRTEIGDRNTFREYATVNSATGDGEATVIGSDNHILAYSHIAHNVTLGNHIIMSNAETRTINKVGMDRNGVAEETQSALRQAYKFLFREGLTIPNALAKIERELP